VVIELTRLEITDSSLELGYKVRNDSDHEIWVCDKVSSMPSEVYLTYDKRTLLIRKRLDVPSHMIWRTRPASGTYRYLGSGAVHQDSMFLSFPISPKFVYASKGTETADQTVRSLVLEIGYYDGDLPALVRSIFQVADRFRFEGGDIDPAIEGTYFPGLSVRSALAGFEAVNENALDRGYVYIDYSYQALAGEKVIRIEIDGVAIPYSGRTEAGAQ